VRIENQRLMSCVKTLCSNLQCLFVLLKGVAGVPSMISIKDMSIGYHMYVMSIMARLKYQKPLLIEGLYYISVKYLI
jgi:hypothetical protein